MKDVEWETESLYQNPRDGSKEVELNRVFVHFSDLKGYDSPHGQVCNHQKSNNLSSWFGS